MATVLVGFFSDAIGRKKTLFYSMIIAVVGIVMILVFNNLVAKCIGLFLWGIGSDIIFPVGASFLS